MKVQIVTPSISQLSGGVGPALLDLCAKVSSYDTDVEFFIDTLDDGGSIDYRQFSPDNVRLHKGFLPTKVGLSLSLIRSVMASDADVIHLHGIWMATSLAAALASFFKDRAVIISPHGMMDPWILRRGRLKKCLAYWGYERHSWRGAKFFHALNSAECNAISRLIPDSEIVTIPNGMDFGNPTPFKIKPVLELLFLGRIHEKKNVMNLIEAVEKIPLDIYQEKPFRLTIAGWGDQPYVKEIVDKIEQNNTGRIRFVGPVYGENKEKLLSCSDIFILPSLSEGLPVAVLEAWSASLVVMMSKECNLELAFSNGAAIQVGLTIESLLEQLLNVLNMSFDELNGYSQVGFSYGQSNYSWPVVCSKYVDMYRDVVKC
jgi:glycosyltransferase involved in cell wall biosynthesis